MSRAPGGLPAGGSLVAWLIHPGREVAAALTDATGTASTDAVQDPYGAVSRNWRGDWV